MDDTFPSTRMDDTEMMPSYMNSAAIEHALQNANKRAKGMKELVIFKVRAGA